MPCVHVTEKPEFIDGRKAKFLVAVDHKIMFVLAILLEKRQNLIYL